jgi:hypothetical protein
MPVNQGVNNVLFIKDNNNVLSIAYDDLIKYHGRVLIGGVALAFKALELSFVTLLPHEIPSREKITSFLTGLGEAGMGVIDGVEMVTRVRTRGLLIADTEAVLNRLAPDAPNGGKYYFELVYDDKKIELTLKEGLIPADFINLSRQARAGTLDEIGFRQLQELRETLAATLMAKSANDIFNFIVKDSSNS